MFAKITIAGHMLVSDVEIAVYCSFQPFLWSKPFIVMVHNVNACEKMVTIYSSDCIYGKKWYCTMVYVGKVYFDFYLRMKIQVWVPKSRFFVFSSSCRNREDNHLFSSVPKLDGYFLKFLWWMGVTPCTKSIFLLAYVTFPSPTSSACGFCYKSL